MQIILVDDEQVILNGGVKELRRAAPDAAVDGFGDAEEAVAFAGAHRVDAAFLDIELRTSSGLKLAERLKQLDPETNIIYVTSYRQYMEQAWGQHVSGYVLKPLTAEKARRELDNLRFPVAREGAGQVRVKTFGDFEIFLDGQPLWFAYTKTKELLAYLVDRRGAMCPQKQLINVLWDDDNADSHVSYFYNLRKDLQSVLADHGVADILVHRRGMLGVVPEKLDCDYYRLLKKDPEAIASYHGEYMGQYSWSEQTGAAISRNLDQDGA